MLKQVSVCPRCGAPVFQDADWQGTSPPPQVEYSCECIADQKKQMEAMQQMRANMRPGMPPGMLPLGPGNAIPR